MTLRTIWRRLAGHPHALLLLLALMITLVLYWRALLLPLYMDDVIFGRYTSGLSLAELFYNISIVPYYRPLSLVPWKVLELLAGGYPAVVMHGFNLLVHALNGWLLAVLALRYTRRLTIALLAGLIYLCFPFSYQAVSWAAALGHLMALCGVLTALLALDHWRRNHSSTALIGVWLGVALAIFSHENGIAVIPILFLRSQYRLLDTDEPRLTRRALAGLFAPALLIALAYTIIWLQLPKDRVAFQLNIEDIAQNALYFSQGLTYPVAWIGNLIGLGEHAGALLALILVGAGFALIIRYEAARRREIVFGLLWYAAAALVPTLFLRHAYAIDGPRLMLLASGGAALAWAASLDGLLQMRSPAILGYAGKGIVLVSILIFFIMGGGFVLQRMELHAQLSRVYETVWKAPDAVFINLPAWIAYRERTFPMGSEGITYLTNYMGVSDLILINTGRERDSLAVTRDDLRPEFEGYFLGNANPQTEPDDIARAINERGRGYMLANVQERWQWLSVQRSDLPAADGFTFENGVRLWIEPPMQDTESPIVLMWQIAEDVTPAALPNDLTAYVHLVCQGALISQADGAPLQGAFPFYLWHSGEVWRDERYLPTRETEGCEVEVGLYTLGNGERVRLVGADAAVVPLNVDAG